jgi:hypothetical protein
MTVSAEPAAPAAGIPNPIAEIKKLTKEVLDLGKKVARLEKQLADSVSKEVYDAAEATIGTLDKEISALTTQINALQQQLAADTSAIADVGTQVAGLVTSFGSGLGGLERTAAVLGDTSKLTPAAKTILTSVVSLAPQVASRAQAIVSRINAVEALGNTDTNEVLTKVGALSGLASELVSTVQSVVDVSSPSTVSSIITALGAAVKGDGATYQKSFSAKLELLTTGIGNTCNAQQLFLPPSLALQAQQLNTAVNTAPSQCFEVLAAIVPLSIFDQAVTALGAASNTVLSRAPKVKTLQASGGASAVIIPFIVVARTVELLLNGVWAILPISAAASQTTNLKLKEQGRLGGGPGAEGDAQVEVQEAATLAVSLTYLGLGPAVFGGLAAVFGTTALILEAVVAGLELT